MSQKYQYKVRDRAGNLVTGTLVADSELLVLQRLREMGYTPLEVGKEKKGLSFEINIKPKKVKLKEIAVFSRQFATMINSGLPILRALSILADQSSNKMLAETLTACRMDVEQGASLSGAMQKHPKVFNDLYISMVKSGETGGSLDNTLLSLASTLEREVHLRGKIKSAMTYPVAVVALVVLIMSAMLLFVVPQFESIYADLGGSLPMPTQVLLTMSKLMQQYWYMVILAVIVARFSFRRYKKTDKGLRGALPQDRDLAVLEHRRHVAEVRRADPAGAGHRQRHREQPDHRACRAGRAGERA
jgi:type IV pilus assembly protein PilC